MSQRRQRLYVRPRGDDDHDEDEDDDEDEDEDEDELVVVWVFPAPAPAVASSPTAAPPNSLQADRPSLPPPDWSALGLEFGLDLDLDRLLATQPTKKTDKSTQHTRRPKCHRRRLSSPRRGNRRFLRGVDLSTPSVCGVAWCGKLVVVDEKYNISDVVEYIIIILIAVAGKKG